MGDNGSSVRYEAAGRAFARLFPGSSLPDPGEAIPGLPTSAAEFRQFIIEITFADSWERPGLDDRSKSLITMAMLVAMGGQPDELGKHVNAALNLGIGRDEIVALLVHAAAYCGVPRAQAGFTVAAGVLASRPE